MAYRLSENGHHRIRVLEFGGTDMGPLIQMPAALSIPMNMAAMIGGMTAKTEPYLGGRRMHCPVARLSGDPHPSMAWFMCAAMPMIMIIGQKVGAQGWSYADVLPYFRRMESWTDGGHGGDPAWRGATAPCTSAGGAAQILCMRPL